MSSSSNSNIQTPQQQGQGLTALLVMIVVLIIILAYCFWGAPWCRAFCRRTICCFCPFDDPENPEPSSSTDAVSSPTIILLPYGRMLVVDRNVFAQYQADSRGVDLLELGGNIIRTQRIQTGSTPSILEADSETTSKGLSPIIDRYSPPTYESIFGFKDNDLPPSYSELSLQLFRRCSQSVQICNESNSAPPQESQENVAGSDECPQDLIESSV